MNNDFAMFLNSRYGTYFSVDDEIELESHFNHLVDEVVLKIFKELDSQECKSLSYVNKRFYKLSKAPEVYASLIERKEVAPYKKLEWAKSAGAHLKKLDLHEFDFTEQAVIDILTICPNSVELKLTNFKVTPHFLKHLSKYLESLTLVRCAIEDNSLQDLKNFNSISCLELIDCVFTNTDLKDIKGLNNLTSLIVGFCPDITDLGLRHIKDLKFLKFLDLSGCSEITNEGLEYLKSLKFLQSLGLAKCNSLSHIKFLKNFEVLQSLDLTKCNSIADKDLKYIKRLSALQSLDLSHCSEITNTGLEYLKEITSLKSLSLSACNQISTIKPFANLKNLNYLKLADCELIADRELEYLKNLSALQYLNLSACSISSEGLESLQSLNALLYLDLSWCSKITNIDCLNDLVSLEVLDLNWCTELHLKQVLKLTSLQFLSLGCCTTTDMEIEYLKQLTALKYLDLRGVQKITVEGLTNLISLQSLRFINLDACPYINQRSLKRLNDLAGDHPIQFVKNSSFIPQKYTS